MAKKPSNFLTIYTPAPSTQVSQQDFPNHDFSKSLKTVGFSSRV